MQLITNNKKIPNSDFPEVKEDDTLTLHFYHHSAQIL